LRVANSVNLVYTIGMKKSKIRPIARSLRNAFNWFDMSLLASMKESGSGDISHSQSLVMSHLTTSGLRISELAKRLRISRQAAQKRVAELKKIGFVSTDTDLTNISAKIVTLTSQGKDGIESALEIYGVLERELSNRIGVDHFECLKKALEKDWGTPITLKKDV